ncbi:SEC-C metal-binding domain-containing protein [Eubacteriales bacterium KG127]
MSLLSEWKDLIDGQTEESFEEFWREYAEAEMTIYKDILSNKDTSVYGTYRELVDKYNVRPVMFTGFLDGVNSSLLDGEIELDTLDEDTQLKLTVNFEKLFYNMLLAEADHLFNLDEWNDVLSEDKRREIYKDFKRSKIVHVEKTPGRNDPCPCGSGKKYKKCCGK